MSKNLIQKTGKNDFKAAFATLDFLEKGTRPTVSSTLSEADSEFMAWKVKPVETKNHINDVLKHTGTSRPSLFSSSTPKVWPSGANSFTQNFTGFGQYRQHLGHVEPTRPYRRKIITKIKRAPPLTKISKP